MRNRLSCAMIWAAMTWTLAGLAALGSLLCGESLPAGQELKVPALAYEKFKLANGLEVIVHEDHRLPLVSLDVWYHVGPANERQGRTGFAHLFEHMMFEGSEHVGEKAHFRCLEAVGATDINGTTDFDRTNYFETLPSNQLGLGLWLESDRMGFLLETLDRTRLTNQRDVVRNERRQGEGFPYELTEEKMFHLLFPREHPYYADVIGSHADIEAARLNDVRDFFQQYYAPNNATLALAGDVDAAALKPLLEKYFGPIPAGPPLPKNTLTTPPILSERRASVTDTVQLSRVSAGWLTPRAFEPGDAEAELLMQILGGGKSSRLYRELVYHRQIAQTVECSDDSLALASVAVCNVTARVGVKPELVEAALDQEIENLRNAGPTQAELDHARNVILTKMIEGLQRRGGFGGIADMLNRHNQYLGDPGYFPQDIARYQRATVSSVQAAARQQFGKTRRCTVFTVPGKKQLEDVPRSPADTDARVMVKNPYTAEFEERQAWRKNAPAPGIATALRLPVPKTFTLQNGLKVYLVEDHALPIFRAELLTRAGAEANPATRPGLAAFTARMLTEGTDRRSALQTADDVDQIGADLKSEADEDAAHATVQALSGNADPALALLGYITQHPRFAPEEVERIRQERLGAILQETDDPVQSLLRVGEKALYGDGPYAYPPNGTAAAVKAVTRAELAGFWSSHYAPQSAALVLAGDLTESDARARAEKYFGNWRANGAAETPSVPQPPVAPARRVIIVDKPGAPQTALGAFGLGLPRTSPDYVPVTVMNCVLGGLFSSRINMNLREKNGFTYGAFSSYSFHRGVGPFLAGALVRTDVTAPAARELFSELDRIRKAPPTPAELQLAKDYQLRSLPGNFEAVKTTAKLIGDLFVYDLPIDYYRTLPAQYDSATPAAVQQAALDAVHPEQLLVVAVGDRAKIQASLEKLNLGPIELRAADGDLLKAQATSVGVASQSENK